MDGAKNITSAQATQKAPLLGGAGGGLNPTHALEPTPNPSKEGNNDGLASPTTKGGGFIEENVSFHAGENQLEGVLAYPEDTSPEQAILLLSPHPHMGGRMDNNVIQHLARRFAEEGCATLRFNYGGVGSSTLPSVEGDALFEYWAKLEEEKNYEAVLPDAIAARNYLAEALPVGVALGYLGYSFGCCLATLLARDYPPAQVAAISPPTRRAPLDGVERLAMPSLFVVGDDDFAFDMSAFTEAFALIPGAKRFVQLDGCDHFFRKQEERVYETIRPCFFGDAAEGIAP